MSQRKGIAWCAGLSALVVLAFTLRQSLPDFQARSGPQTVDDAIAVAESLGLYHGTDQRSGGPIGRLVVSDMPVTWERAGWVRLNGPHHPCWTGTVAIYYPARQMINNYDPVCSVYWGNLFVYGDPMLIERLTGIRPEAP